MEISLQYKIPNNWNLKRALDYRWLIHNHLEAQGILCDAGIGLGYLDIHAICKTSKDEEFVKALAKIEKWEIIHVS